jgi:hypothetical protein
MKRLFFSFVSALSCFACLLALVAGCAIFEPTDTGAIRFSAASSLSTKVYYGYERDGYMQMVWETGDQIRIVSDRARTPEDAGSLNWHDYSLRHDREEGSHSFAKFDLAENEKGLRWEDSGTYNFWATYPPVNVTEDGRFVAQVPNDSYLMVAHTRTSYDENRQVFLSFYPAFTAIEMTVVSDDDNVTISDCELFSTSTPLTGRFSALIGDSGIYSYTPTQTSRSASPSLVSGGGSYKTFTFFCLPQDLRGVSVTCHYVKNGSSYSKSLELTESGSSMVFSACKYHRLSLTLDSSGGGGGEIDMHLTVGGAQMLLYVLSNHESGWPSAIMRYSASQFGISDPVGYLNSTGWSNATPFYQDYFGKWQVIMSKISHFINYNGWNQANERFNSTSTVFPDDSEHFTQDELAAITGFLATVTGTGSVGNGNTMITDDIVATDFAWMPGLTTIDCLQTDQNMNPRPSVEIASIPALTYINLNYYTYVTVSDCGGSGGVAINMSNANNTTGELIVRDLKLNDNFNIGNQHAHGPVTFDNVSGLSVLSLGNATNAHVQNCPDLTTVNVTTAHELTDYTVENCNNFTSFSISNAGSNFKNLTLKNTPYFTQGTATTGLNGLTINLENCSSSVAAGTTPYIFLQNTTLSTVTVNRDALSSRVEIRN